jgi:hypothetical protein
MKELIGTGSNIYYTRNGETGNFEPQAEVVLMLSEPQYVFKSGKIQKSRATVKTFRFTASPAGIGVLLKTLVETMEQIEKQSADTRGADADKEQGEK